MSSDRLAEAVIVLTTIGTSGDGEALARTLVAERLAACVNLLPEMQSIYLWKGELTVDGERQLLIKTTVARLDALKTRLHALHPYEVPEVLVLPVTGGSPGYLKWLAESTAVEP
jgi:periplasmic divalent cation tolerance protein